MPVAVGPNLVVVAVVMHSSRVIVAAGTVTMMVFATADSNQAVKREVETVAVAGSSPIAEQAVGSSFVAGEIEAALAAGIVVVAVPIPVVVGEIA